VWSDNASDIDLLGYEDLIDDVVALALDTSLQPLTIGAFADWGAGKSTLLRLAASSLRDAGALVVEFSPWLVEGYDDVKSCLLGAVVDAVDDAQSFAEESKDWAASLVTSLRRRINWLRLAKLGASAVVPIAGVALGALESVLKADDKGESPDPKMASSADVSKGFHREFEELVGGLEAVSSVVVLIDDLDRCLPDKVIDTLEAIRLFLAAPGTAFVIAADERVVRDAVRHRYPMSTAAETNIAKDYLEKLVHVPLRIPPLAAPAAETYCNLLVAHRALEADPFAKVLAAAQRLRRSGDLTVACNLGIVRDALDGAPLPAEAEKDFGLIAQIVGPLTSGLNGNPRQIKRFLNSFNLRRRTADRRQIDIDQAVLAKLTVLEYVKDARFREIHEWQLRGGGIPSEISGLEASLANEEPPVSGGVVAQAWLADEWCCDWLRTEPSLKGVDLSPYFFLARDRLGSSIDTSDQLPPGLQALATRLAEDSAALRESAVDEVVALEPQSVSVLVQAACARLPGLEDKQPMMRSLLEIAENHKAMVPSVLAAFGHLAYPAVPADIPLIVARRLAGSEERQLVVELLATWERQDASAQLSRMALRARTSLVDGNGDV